jgi:aryl-alcohol dehydrogenase-like predicted oxidoreductase
MSTPLPLVLGTAQLGLPYGISNKTGKPDMPRAFAIVLEAWESGIREFDTAQAYGDSELILGKAIAELGFSQKAKIISKFKPNLNHLNAQAMSRSLDQSLERLGVQSLFGIMLHREDMLSLWDKGLGEILHSFVSSGRVKKIGVSLYSPDKAIEALNTEGVHIIQIPTNILDRRFENAGVFKLADEKKKEIYIRSVFLQGLLLIKSEEIAPEMAFARSVIEKLVSLSNDSGLSRQEIALGYIKSKMPKAYVIFGAEIPGQVRENVEAWKKKIPESLGNKVRALFANVDERILNPSLWPH